MTNLSSGPWRRRRCAGRCLLGCERWATASGGRGGCRRRQGRIALWPLRRPIRHDQLHFGVEEAAHRSASLAEQTLQVFRVLTGVAVDMDSTAAQPLDAVALEAVRHIRPARPCGWGGKCWRWCWCQAALLVRGTRCTVRCTPPKSGDGTRGTRDVRANSFLASGEYVLSF